MLFLILKKEVYLLLYATLPGNSLGEEGCEALREAMENMDKGGMLASLR